MKFSLKNNARKIALLILSVWTLEIGARAGVLDDIGGAISSLRDQKNRKIGAAQDARSKARAQAEQVEFLHQRLLKTQRLLDGANANYIDSFKQMQRTEERIEETQTRAKEVAARYEEHRKQFGLRLASMQRHGQTNFLQVALGSMSLSDLSRRTAFFQALTQRDAAMQAQIKGDKAELEESQNALMAQWKERRALQKQAARERKRIAAGEAEQVQSWKQMNRARYQLLSFAVQQQRSLNDIDGKIGGLRNRQSQVLSENAERAALAREREAQARERQAQASEERARMREARARLAEFRAEAQRERDAMRAQAAFRSRVRRRVVRNYKRASTARRYAFQQREESARNVGRSRYGNSRYGNRRYGNSRIRYGRSRRNQYARNSYSRNSARNSLRSAMRETRYSPQLAPRVGLMPRYAPRIELAPMPIEALQNPARLAPAAP